MSDTNILFVVAVLKSFIYLSFLLRQIILAMMNYLCDDEQRTPKT